MVKKIEEFVNKVEICSSGFGFGNGYGDCYGYGKGSGNGYGDGDGYGYGNGKGSGNGYGDGDGDGDGYGYGNGKGNGYGKGDGKGYGSGYGIKKYCGNTVYMIDNVATIIRVVRGNIAKGYILLRDLSLKSCYVARIDDNFAHGESIREALSDARGKAMLKMSKEDRILAFNKHFTDDKAYPNSELYEWHHILTGSCDMGRREFAKQHGIDVENGKMTAKEFISLTENSYGKEIIKKLKESRHERP